MSTPTENIFALAQEEIKALLEADAYFVDIPIIAADDHELTATIQRSMGVITAKATKRGACVVILGPVANDSLPDTSESQLNMSIVLRVGENPLVNRGSTGTQKRATTIARRVSRLLKCHSAGSVFKLLAPAKPHIVPVEDPNMPVAFEVVWEAEEDDPGTITRVAMPTITEVADTVTISCATAGATIKYTTDGTTPFASTATTYSAPFAVTPPKRIRAAATKTSCLPSSSQYLDVT